MIPEAHARPAIDFLREATPPRFRTGHTLPPLSRWGWTMPYDVRVELAERWGYALEFGGYANPKLVAQLDDPKSVSSKLCALTVSDPKRYPLCVLLHRPCMDKAFRESLPPETWCRDADGNFLGKRKVWSPEAPAEVFKRAGAEGVEPLKAILKEAPVAMILNGGECGLNVFGWGKKAWTADPVVLKAKGEQSWLDYISERKRQQELPIITAVREVAPDRTLYIFYHTCAAHRKRYGGWWVWTWDYKATREFSDLPSSSVYYAHFNTGWTGGNDMLTQALNSVAQQHQFGDALSYNWLCAGWTRKKMGARAFGDLRRYMGYLKCYYTAGMIGGVAGYFSFPKGGFGADLGDEPPHWLRQKTVLSHAHALFSHLEDFLHNGDLLPGPKRHRWSKDLPAYEFPTGDATVRALVRKHREHTEWLITVWAAAGEDRDVSVTVPELGEVSVRARGCGSVYRAVLREGKPELTLVDRDGMTPTLSD